MTKLQLGFIGTGGIAHLHGKHLSEIDEAEITAIADVSEASRDTFVSAFGLEKARQFTDYKEMLDQAELDAVIICSPHTLHFEQAKDVMNSGRHVLIEKPMTCSSEEAEQLIRISEQTGKKLQVSYQRHFQPEFIYIQQAIADGTIGQLTSITASLYQEWKQMTANTWRQVPNLSGGGMLMDSGSHIIDVLLWTTGLTPLEVKPQLHQQGADVEIDSFTSIRFEEGPVASLNIVGFAPGWHETYVFCGENGGIFYENGKITLRRKGEEPIVPELPQQTTNQDQSFIDAINGKHEIMVPGVFAQKVVTLTEKIYQEAGYKPY